MEEEMIILWHLPGCCLCCNGRLWISIYNSETRDESRIWLGVKEDTPRHEQKGFHNSSNTKMDTTYVTIACDEWRICPSWVSGTYQYSEVRYLGGSDTQVSSTFMLMLLLILRYQTFTNQANLGVTWALGQREPSGHTGLGRLEGPKIN